MLSIICIDIYLSLSLCLSCYLTIFLLFTLSLSTFKALQYHLSILYSSSYIIYSACFALKFSSLSIVQLNYFSQCSPACWPAFNVPLCLRGGLTCFIVVVRMINVFFFNSFLGHEFQLPWKTF